MKKKPEKLKPPTHLHKMVIKLTAPIKMDQDIELGALAVMVGANDSGKSFMLKLAYALTTTGMSKDGPAPLREAAQFVFDNTFSNQNLDGSVKGIYTQGFVSVDLEKGKVTNVVIENLDNPVGIVFMSTDMRTFDQMNLYLRMRKECGQDMLIFMKKILEAYRLYDVTYMEALIARCPIQLGDMVMKSMQVFDFKEEITSIEVDKDKCEFTAVLKDGSTRALSTYGKGHQAVLNMFMGVGK